MTTPLGSIEIGPREGRRVTVARTTRETDITVTLGLDGEGHRAIDTGIGFYDHLLGSLAHHGLFDLAISADGDLQVDEHHTVEDVALVLGSAFAEALGDRAGIARFGQSSVPMDEALAHAVVDVGGRPYAVIDLPFRGERVGGLPLQLVEHALESFARTAGVTLHLSGTGRNDHHLAEAAFKALGRALRAACDIDPRRDGRGLDQGRPRVSASPRLAVVDYGAGNLVSIDQALTRVGATVTVARDAEALRGADALIVPGVGAAGPAMARLDAHGLSGPDPGVAGRRPAVPRDLPRAPAPVRGQRRGRRGDARRRARPDRPARARADAAAHRLEPGRARRGRTRCSTASTTAPTSTSSIRTPAIRGRDADELVLATTDHGAPFVSAIARDALLGVQFHPERSGADGLRLLANFVDLVRAA